MKAIAMRANKGPGGELCVIVSNDERYLIKQCLNECCNGFRISDFAGKIGAERSVVAQMLDQLGNVNRSSVGATGGVRIARLADGNCSLTLTQKQAHILLNCMKETERALGAGEFPSRFGATLDEVKGLFSLIESASAQ